jgi:hypothetical protein
MCELEYGKKKRQYAGALLVFLVISACALAGLYRSALWGERLLAPLDVAPSLFPKYQWLDPSTAGVPKNHYIVDMFDFELPRQFAFYQALHAGEFAWWEPYSDGGHPLIAEAHNNLTDPFRLLLYWLCPFVLAYNWVDILHSFFAGLSMFILLRHLGFSSFATIFGALSFQFASSHPLFVFPPCVEASFLYFPLLWVVWSSFLQKAKVAKICFGALLCAAVFVAGNQQSHAYLPLFGLCFCIGYSWRSWCTWRAALKVTFASGVLGALLASPVLIPQIEIFFQSKRDLTENYHFASLGSGVLSLSGIFPWILGTFRTVDLSKLTNQTALGFTIYIGTAGMLLACLGIFWRFRDQWQSRPELRASALLVLCHLGFICSTPLVKLLYTRSSDLAVIGLIVCSARGIDLLLARTDERTTWRFLKRANAGLALIVVLINVLSFVVYPRLQSRLEARFVRDQAEKSVISAPRALRVFQVNNWPNEVTFRNPETGLALLSALMLLVIFKLPRSRLVQAAVLALNLAPLLLFANRFLPSSPVESWTLLLKGGPEQNRIRDLLAPIDGRLEERTPSMFECVFPGAAALYYRVHTFSSYAAFFLKTPEECRHLPPSNLMYASTNLGAASGEFINSHLGEQLRFIWKGEPQRHIKIVTETFNSILVTFEPGPEGQIIRTDSYYPGWAASNEAIKLVRGGLQTYSVPAGVGQIEFHYRPRFFHQALVASGLTGLVLVCASLVSLKRGTSQLPRLQQSRAPGSPLQKP